MSGRSPLDNEAGSSRDHEPAKKKRSKSGCLTCRLRKKRCDEARPSCATCMRLGLECLGYETKRPDWMGKREVINGLVSTMKKNMAETNTAKRRQRWSEVAANKLGAREQAFVPEGSWTETPEALNSTALHDERPTAGPSSSSSHPMTSSPDFVPLASVQASDLLEHQLNDLFSYPAPQAEIVDDPSPVLGQPNFSAIRDHATVQERRPPQQQISLDPPTPHDIAPPSPPIDPNIIELLGFDPSSPLVTQLAAPAPYLPLLSQPSALFHTTFASTPAQMRYFNHYLTVIMPYQWIFERRPLSDLVTPLAFANPLVFESVNALAALHMGSKRHRRRKIQSPPSSRVAAMSDDVEDPDLAVAEATLQRSIASLKSIPFNELGSLEMIVAAMSISSFHLFDGGNRKGWKEAVALCRKSLAAIVHRSLVCAKDGFPSLALPTLLRRMGHLLAPLVWTDILTSVTEGVASQFMPLYRSLLVDNESDSDLATFLRETVMGCDSTTRLALAETIALSEWRGNETRAGRLSVRALLNRATVVENLLAQRPWRERHLFEDTEAAHQRRAVSDIFYHSARVLLATTVNGSHPAVPEVVAAVTDTASAFCALDQLDLPGADRALVFPAVIAGCHANTATMQAFFKGRFVRLGEAAAEFGNTQNALRLMEEVWRRRAGAVESEEVHWRKVMFELDDEGLLLI